MGHHTSSFHGELYRIIYSDDGFIRCLPFTRLVKSSCEASEVSDMPLQGNVVSLHVVESERTKERLVIGGADDGTIAVWATK